MPAFHVLLALFGMLSLIALAWMVRWERRKFIRMGKGGAWLAVRLTTIPVALATAVLAIVPARSTSGMEGLAVFYIMLLAIAPVFWFGVHWMAGKLARPPLSLGESAQIAGSPIALAIVLAMLAHALQPMAWSLLKSLGN